MTIRQLPNPKSQWFNSSGAPLSGGKIYTYVAGTSTAKNTYSDHLGATPNANPVILDSRGEATIYWDGSYKVVVKDSNDVTIYTLDNHGGGSIEDVSAQRSLLLNYSFEDDDDGDGEPDNWTITLYTNGTQTLDASAGGQIHGAKALKFTSTGTGGGYAESDLFLVHEGETVPVTFATKSSAADVRNLVELVWYDRAQAVLSTSSIYDDSTTNPTSWTDKTGSATAPANSRFAKLRLTGCHSSDATVGSTWFDDVRVSDSVTLTGTQTLTNKTLTAPVLAGTTNVSGGQLQFPATQNPSADVNTLDDYEEGTWTPSLGGSTTYTTQEADYTKIGRVVFIRGLISVNTIGTGSTTVISGLPFTAAANDHLINVEVITASATSIVSSCGLLDGTSITIRSKTVASTGTAVNAIFQNSTEVRFDGFYFV